MGGSPQGLDDAASIAQTIAPAAFAHKTQIALSYSQYHSLRALSHKTLSAVVPVKVGGVVAAVTHYGSQLYNELQLSSGYALRISPSIAVGVALHYLHTSTADPYYTPQHLFTASAAVEARPTESLTMGAKVFNPFAVKLAGESGERVPALFAAGLSYKLLPQLLASLQVEKGLYTRARVQAGVEYTFLEHYSLRGGLSTEPMMYTFGVGAVWGQCTFDFAAGIHPVLGLTPQLTAQYTF